MKRQVSNTNKTARRTSLLLHAGLIALALYPFRHSTPSRDQPTENIVITFASDAITSGSASTAPNKATKPNPTTEAMPQMTPKAVPAPPSASVLEEPESPVEIKEQSPTPDIIPETTPETVEVGQEAEEAPPTTEDTPSDSADDSPSEGEGETGDHITGKALGEMDLGGEGNFGRKVIYRAPIANAAKENGVVSVNICVNRAGRVTHAIVYKPGTTLQNRVYIDQAKNIATQYRFEEDYSAPTTQCGQLTFIFKIKKAK